MTLKDYIMEHGTESATDYTALALVAAFRAADPEMPEPDAAYGNGKLLLAWDDSRYHFEVEFLGLDYEMFILDRNTGYSADLDSDEAHDYIRYILNNYEHSR